MKLNILQILYFLKKNKKPTTLFRGGRAWSPEAEQHDWILSRCRHTLTTRAVILTGVDACDAVIVAPSQRRMQITWLHWTCLGDNGHPRPSAHPPTRSGHERVGVSSSRLLVQPGPETRVFSHLFYPWCKRWWFMKIEHTLKVEESDAFSCTAHAHIQTDDSPAWPHRQKKKAWISTLKLSIIKRYSVIKVGIRKIRVLCWRTLAKLPLMYQVTAVPKQQVISPRCCTRTAWRRLYSI